MHVDHLQRIRVANVTLRDLKPGEWRLLEGEELEGLLRLLGSAGGIGASADRERAIEAAKAKKKKEEKAREEQAKKNAPGRRL